MAAPHDDLFSSALEERLSRQAPLAARMRPRSLDEVVGQQHLLAPGAPLRALIDSDRISSLILWGPPGTGKTTLARLIAGATSKAFTARSAVTVGVKDVREVIDGARRLLAEQGRGTILFLDFTTRPRDVRHVRSPGHSVVWDTPPGRLCTPHWRSEHMFEREPLERVDRPSCAARRSPRRAAVVGRPRHTRRRRPRPG